MSSMGFYKNPGQKWGFSVVYPGYVAIGVDLSFLEKNLPAAQLWLGNQVLHSCRARMPLRTGNVQQRSGAKVEPMKERSSVEEGGTKVVFPGPYARFQYMGKVMIGEQSRSPWAMKDERKVVTDRPLKYSRAEATSFWFEAARETDEEAWIEGTRKELLQR